MIIKTIFTLSVSYHSYKKREALHTIQVAFALYLPK